MTRSPQSLFLYLIRDTMVEPVHKTSFTNATGYILSILFTSHRAHHIAENWRSRFSLVLLLAITANTPASNGNMSIHVANVRMENPTTSTVKVIGHSLCDTHAHLSFIEYATITITVSAQDTALVKSLCNKKYSTQHA